MNGEKKITGKKNIILSVLSILLLCVLLFPLFWILMTSLKTEQEIFRIPPTIIPEKLNLASYAAQVETGDFNMFQSFANSFIISIGATIISVVLAVPASYGIAKYRFRGRKVMLLGFLVTQMLPVAGVLLPLFIFFRGMKLYKTTRSAILGGANHRNPLFVFDLKK